MDDYSKWHLISERWVRRELGYVYSDFVNMVFPRLRSWVNDHATIPNLPDLTFIADPHQSWVTGRSGRVRALPVEDAKRLKSLLRVWHKTLGVKDGGK